MFGDILQLSIHNHTFFFRDFTGTVVLESIYSWHAFVTFISSFLYLIMSYGIDVDQCRMTSPYEQCVSVKQGEALVKDVFKKGVLSLNYCC